MPKTNKSLAKLIDTVNTNSSSNLKNIESISKDISSLKDLMIEDRALNARLRKLRIKKKDNLELMNLKNRQKQKVNLLLIEHKHQKKLN